jgi:hypothetical protein
MSVLVGDCPRCGAKKMTMDVRQQNFMRIMYDWQHWYELFCICRDCKCGSIIVVSQRHIQNERLFTEKGGLVKHEDALNDLVKNEGYINVRHRAQQKPPQHVTDEIAAAFNEAATCLATECWNAAAAMFRTSIDVATRSLLPAEETEGLSKKTQRDLGLRLPWLFANGRLPKDLEELSKCVREDGNDGVHAFSLGKEDAEDLLDFTTALLERLFTEPERLRLAQARRDERRKPNN